MGKINKINECMTTELGKSSLELQCKEPYGCGCSAVTTYLSFEEARRLKNILDEYLKLEEIENAE